MNWHAKKQKPSKNKWNSRYKELIYGKRKSMEYRLPDRFSGKQEHLIQKKIRKNQKNGGT